MLETVQKEKRLCFTPWFQDLCVGVKGYFICQSIWSANSKNFMWFNLKFSCHFHILSKICVVVKRSVFHDILLREDYLHLYSLIFPVKHIFLKGNILANVLIYSELGANLHLLLFLWHFVVFFCEALLLSFPSLHEGRPLCSSKLMISSFHWNDCFAKNIHCIAIYL